MASICRISPLTAGTWSLVVDAYGTIQSTEGQGPASLAAGSNYFDFFSELCGENSPRMAALQAGIAAAAAGKDDTITLEFPCGGSQDEGRWRVTARPCSGNGAPGVLLVHTLTAEGRRQAEQDARTSRMEALGRLTSGVAHDFANLLTLISGYSEMLLARVGAQNSMCGELQEIHRAALRGAGMTSQILNFIRHQGSQAQPVNLNSLVTELVKLLQPIIGEHIVLSTVLDPELGEVKADSEQMSRVVMNLVLNARDAMPHGGRLMIRTENLELPPDPARELPAGRYVTLALSDTGMGMDAETMDRIFDPFFSTKVTGTGLGLSTVRAIIKDNQGAIWAQSQPGNGSTFTMCLPRASDAEPAEAAPLTRPGAGTETILLAEDEQSVRTLLKHLLSIRGYQVLEAGNGPDALRILKQNPDGIDLLLTDMVMPGMSGPELAQEARTCKPGLKVIYMSGYTDDMLVNTGGLRPGMAFLRKPLRPDVLTGSIRQVLDGKS